MSGVTLRHGGGLVLIGAASDRNVGEMVGLLNECVWADTRDMAGKSLLCSPGCCRRWSCCRK